MGDNQSSQQNQQQDPPAGQQPGQQPGQQSNQQPAAPADFETWLKEQPEEIRKLYDSHTAGLRSALQSERSQRNDLARQLREAASKAEQGSEAQKNLAETAAKLEEAESRASFFEEATKPEIGCTNPRLAYLAARESQAVDGKGRINWEALKNAYPELFKPKGASTTAPAGNAGAGTGTQPPPKFDMNASIRKAAGRQ